MIYPAIEKIRLRKNKTIKLSNGKFLQNSLKVIDSKSIKSQINKFELNKAKKILMKFNAKRRNGKFPIKNCPIVNGILLYFFMRIKFQLCLLSDEIMLRKLENNDNDNDNRKNQ